MKLLNIYNQLEEDFTAYKTKGLGYNNHFIDRIKQRVNNNLPYDVILNYWSQRQRRYVNEYIGEYTLDSGIVQKLLEGYEFLKKIEPQSTSTYNFIIKMHHFDLTKEKDKIEYDPNLDEQEIEEIWDEILNGDVNIFIRDKNTKSYGQTLITLIENNYIKSTMFTVHKDDTNIEDQISKGRFFIVLDSPFNIEQYLDLSPL